MRHLFQEKKTAVLGAMLSLCTLVSCGSVSENSFENAENGSADLTEPADSDGSDAGDSTESSDIVTEAQSEYLPEDMTRQSAWMLVILRETPPANYTQNITVIDDSGFIYEEKYTRARDSLHFNEENWYEQLTDLYNSSDSTETLVEEAFKTVSDFMENAGTYRDVPITRESTGLKDYGVKSVYGVYDTDEEPQYIEICSYGAYMECINHEDTRAFANDLVNLGLFYTFEHAF